MTSIAAVYRHGVFEPSEPVNFADGQRVQLNIEPANDQKGRAWLEEVRTIQDGIVRRAGILPDSTYEIAADRLR